MKNKDKFKFVELAFGNWFYSYDHYDSILLDEENKIIKINSMKDLEKINFIVRTMKGHQHERR